MLVNWEYMGPIVWVELSASNPSDSFAGYEYVARSHISHEGGGDCNERTTSWTSWIAYNAIHVYYAVCSLNHSKVGNVQCVSSKFRQELLWHPDLLEMHHQQTLFQPLHDNWLLLGHCQGISCGLGSLVYHFGNTMEPFSDYWQSLPLPCGRQFWIQGKDMQDWQSK